MTFFVDPSIDDDPNMKYVDTITLSYTFFPAASSKAPVKPVAAISGAAGEKPL